MSPATSLWARIALCAAISLALVLALAPPQPEPRLSALAAAPIGLTAGLLLFVLVTGHRPRLSRGAAGAPRLVVKLAFFGLWAGYEEVLWRRVALGELLQAGIVPALAGSTIGFALMHRRRPIVHVGTGGAFGVLYLSTGVLAASVAAHWTYNVLVDGLAQDPATREEPP